MCASLLCKLQFGASFAIDRRIIGALWLLEDPFSEDRLLLWTEWRIFRHENRLDQCLTLFCLIDNPQSSNRMSRTCGDFSLVIRVSWWESWWGPQFLTRLCWISQGLSLHRPKETRYWYLLDLLDCSMKISILRNYRIRLSDIDTQPETMAEERVNRAEIWNASTKRISNINFATFAFRKLYWSRKSLKQRKIKCCQFLSWPAPDVASSMCDLSASEINNYHLHMARMGTQRLGVQESSTASALDSTGIAVRMVLNRFWSKLCIRNFGEDLI